MGGSMGRFIISVASVALLRSLGRLSSFAAADGSGLADVCAFYIHELGLLHHRKHVAGLNAAHQPVLPVTKNDTAYAKGG
jgi:hypothetical protein